MAFDPVLPCEQTEVGGIGFIIAPQVQSIKITTELDDGTPGKGMIFGNTYTLEVEKYFHDKKPKNKDEIKWECTYNTSNGELAVAGIKEKGDRIKFKVEDVDLLGKTLTFHAYVGEAREDGASLNVWVHYRFRWFAYMQFEEGLKARKKNPQNINQHHTSLCGVAAMMYFFAKDYPDIFYNAFMEFFRTGTSKINQYELQPNKSLYDMQPVHDNKKYPRYKSSGLMGQTDWIVLAGTRSSDNRNYEGKEGEDFDAINWVGYIEKMAKQFYEINEVITEITYSPPIVRRNSFIDTIWTAFMEIDKLFNNGYHILILIDADMLNNVVSTFGCATQYHWISYLGGLKINEKQYTFNYYCYAAEKMSITFAKKVVESNFYGYVAFLKRTVTDSAAPINGMPKETNV
ncbi:MAG: hypothetical protein LBL33_08230 [Tannerella sp.]|jgi:hypothetical protein|nr:hypothetical protein [Tannerella sp.]